MHRRSLPLLLAVVLAPLLATGVTTGASPAGGTAPDTARASSGVVERAVTRVTTAVERGRAGRDLPRKTIPALGTELNNDRANLGNCDYSEPHDDAGGDLCERGDRSASRSLVVLGDSHGKHWIPGIEAYADKHGWSTYYLVKEQCTASIVKNGDPDEARPTEPWKACQDFRDWTISAIADLQPKVVIVSTSTPTKGVFTDAGYSTDPRKNLKPYRAGFTKLFGKIADVSDARIVLLRDVPARKPGTDPEKCWKRRGNDLGDCLSPVDSQRTRVALIDASVDAAKRAGVQVSDPTRFFCARGVCPVVLPNGVLPYRNVSHITATYARRLAEPLAKILKLR